MFTSKILYCYWVCLAEDDDDFLVITTKSLPSEDAKTFIRNNVIGKSNEEIAQVKVEISNRFKHKRKGRNTLYNIVNGTYTMYSPLTIFCS